MEVGLKFDQPLGQSRGGAWGHVAFFSGHQAARLEAGQQIQARQGLALARVALQEPAEGLGGSQPIGLLQGLLTPPPELLVAGLLQAFGQVGALGLPGQGPGEAGNRPAPITQAQGQLGQKHLGLDQVWLELQAALE